MRRHPLVAGIALSLLAGSLAITGCVRTTGRPVLSIGTVKDVKYNISQPFSAIRVEGIAEVQFRQTSGPASVTGKLPPHLVGHISAKVVNGTLVISSDDKANTVRLGDRHPVIYVSAPTLSAVHTTGTGDFECKSPVNCPDGLTVTLEGTGDFEAVGLTSNGNIALISSGTGDVEVKRLTAAGLAVTLNGTGDCEFEQAAVSHADLKLYGTGDIEIAGKAKTVNMQLDGSGDIKALRFFVDKGRAVLNGMGDIDCKVTDLNQSVDGLGDIKNH